MRLGRWILSPFYLLAAVIYAIVSAIRRRLNTRRARREQRRHEAAELRREHEEYARQRDENILISTQARSLAELRQQVKLLKEALKQQIEINARDAMRVAWETANFARRTEQDIAGMNAAKSLRAMVGGAGGYGGSYAANGYAANGNGYAGDGSSGVAGMPGMGRNDLQAIFDGLGE